MGRRVFDVRKRDGALRKQDAVGQASPGTAKGAAAGASPADTFRPPQASLPRRECPFPMRLPTFERFYGVDFSGAKRAGDFIWVAEVTPFRRGFSLAALRSLTELCGTAER